jgi:hypothetical protein
VNFAVLDYWLDFRLSPTFETLVDHPSVTTEAVRAQLKESMSGLSGQQLPQDMRSSRIAFRIFRQTKGARTGRIEPRVTGAIAWRMGLELFSRCCDRVVPSAASMALC